MIIEKIKRKVVPFTDTRQTHNYTDKYTKIHILKFKNLMKKMDYLGHFKN